MAKKHKITHYAKDVICLILAKFINNSPVYQQLFDRLLLGNLKSGKIYTGKQMRTFMFFAIKN